MGSITSAKGMRNPKAIGIQWRVKVYRHSGVFAYEVVLKSQHSYELEMKVIGQNQDYGRWEVVVEEVGWHGRVLP